MHIPTWFIKRHAYQSHFSGLCGFKGYVYSIIGMCAIGKVLFILQMMQSYCVVLLLLLALNMLQSFARAYSTISMEVLLCKAGMLLWQFLKQSTQYLAEILS